MKARSNSATAEFTAKTPPDSPEYREKVALPTMEAVDQMPSAFRELVNEFGYIEVYRLWRRGLSVPAIRRRLLEEQMIELTLPPTSYDNVKY